MKTGILLPGHNGKNSEGADDEPVATTPRKRKPHAVRISCCSGDLFLSRVRCTSPATKRYYRHHPSLDDNPKITQTSDGRPGDPLNVALIGTKEQVDAIMRTAKWDPAAALGILSDIKIAEGTVLSRPDANAPVSNLILFGRKEDLAFEQPVGGNPRQRNHVRFWKIDKADDDGRPIWIGYGIVRRKSRIQYNDNSNDPSHFAGPREGARSFVCRSQSDRRSF